MTAYSLFVHQGKTLSTAAGDQKEALADFGKQLGQKLDTEDLDGVVAWYLLDEWNGHGHWTDHEIRVFATPL